MSITLTSIDGKPAVELPGRKGKPVPYLFTVVVSTPRLFEVRLTKPSGVEYLVLIGEGWQRCECADHRCRKRTCKHGRAAMELRQVLAMLAMVETKVAQV